MSNLQVPSSRLFEIKEKDNVVSEGALYCPECSRFFPIIEEIPIMLPDETRDKKQEIKFLKDFQDKLPEKLLQRQAHGIVEKMVTNLFQKRQRLDKTYQFGILVMLEIM